MAAETTNPTPTANNSENQGAANQATQTQTSEPTATETNTQNTLPATSASGKTFCSPCMMGALDKKIKKETYKATGYGTGAVVGAIVFFKSQGVLWKSITGIATAVLAFLSIKSIVEINKIKATKEMFEVYTPQAEQSTTENQTSTESQAQATNSQTETTQTSNK